MIFLRSPLFSLGIRAVQLLFAFLIFVLGCAVVAKGIWKSLPALSIVSGIFSMAYYVLTLLPFTLAFLSPAAVLGLEIWTSIWWLIAFACAAQDFGATSCDFDSFFFSSKWNTACEIGKALLAFGVLGWVLSLVTVGLVGFYAIHPIVSNTAPLWYHRPHFLLGAIFPRETPAPVTDAEQGVVDTDHEEKAVDENATPETIPEPVAEPVAEPATARTTEPVVADEHRL